MLNRKKRLALSFSRFSFLMYNTEGADQKEDDSCSHYCRSTEISRLSHFRFTLPEINFVISILIINSNNSLFQILSCTKIEKGSEIEKWRWWTGYY